MSFWGLNTAGREAKGFPREIGAWNFDQYKDWVARSRQDRDRGTNLTNDAINYWQNQYRNPLTATGVRQTGAEIMPVQQVLNDRTQRITQIGEGYQNNVTPAATTADQVSRYLDQAAGNVNRTGDQMSQEINDSAIRQSDISGNYTEGMIQNLLTQYPELKDRFNAAFGGLREGNKAAFGDIRKLLDESFTNAHTELEKTNPTGEYRAATTSRSFGPEFARANERIKRFGIDPNSPEAHAALSLIGSDRARAVDDAIARETGAYADRAIGLELGRGDAMTGAIAGELGNELDLGTAQAGGDTRLTENLISGVTGLQQGNLQNQLSIEGVRSMAQQGNLQNLLNQHQAILDQRGQTALVKRALEQEDWGTISNVMRELNDEGLLGIDLNQQQFETGLGFDLTNRELGTQAISQLLGIGEADLQRALQSANTAQGFGSDSLEAMLAQYGIELPNAGWGKKLLGGIGMGALRTILGG